MLSVWWFWVVCILNIWGYVLWLYWGSDLEQLAEPIPDYQRCMCQWDLIFPCLLALDLSPPFVSTKPSLGFNLAKTPSRYMPSTASVTQKWSRWGNTANRAILKGNPNALQEASNSVELYSLPGVRQLTDLSSVERKQSQRDVGYSPISKTFWWWDQEIEPG